MASICPKEATGVHEGLNHEPKAGFPAGYQGPPSSGVAPVDLRAFMEQVRQKRLELGLSLQDVAVQAEISVPYLCQLERGQKTNPTLQTLERLARALNLPLQVQDPSADDSLAAARDLIQRTIKNQSEMEQRKMIATTARARLAWVLKKLLGLAGVTRELLADRLQLSLKGLDDILNLRTGFNPTVCKRLCRLTNIPEDYFYKGILNWEHLPPGPTGWDEVQGLIKQLALEGVSATQVRAALLALRSRR